LSDYVPSLRFPLQKIETNESKYWESLISDVIASLQFNKPLPSACSKPLRIFMESENGRGLWNWYFSKGFPDSMYCTDAEINEDYNTFRFRLTARDKAEYRLSAIISKENELIQLRWW
jgi:hypothetical protein